MLNLLVAGHEIFGIGGISEKLFIPYLFEAEGDALERSDCRRHLAGCDVAHHGGSLGWIDVIFGFGCFTQGEARR
jgi:hypothetical protein